MDQATQAMAEEAYFETVNESLEQGHSKMTAHKEGVVAASMLLAALTGVEDEAAKSAIVALNLRPGQQPEQ